MAELEVRRNVSRKMLAGFLRIIRVLVKEVPKEQLRIGFEWPRGCDGWREPLLSQIRSILRHTCDFDGCMYGIPGSRKPWRVVTNYLPLTGYLNRKCDRSHEHVALRGKYAARSGFYTWSMVHQIAKG